MDDVVTYEVIDRVAVVTMNRPAVKNAMNLAMFEQLGQAARRADADRGAGAVLVRGAGGVFSSGLDLSLFADGGGPQDIDEDFIAGLQDSFTAFEEVDKPVVAAIEGHCYGGGIQLAAACHVRAVAPSAKLAVLERRLGLVPDLGGTHRLPRLIGLGRATELTLTGRIVPAEEALAIGLAEVALGADDPQGEALAYTAALAAGPGAVRRAPRLLRENVGQPRDVALALERRAQLACLAGPDVIEAATAFLQGREPQFTGE
jgi:enoyl-CoA hydratase/carnithine racemase